MDQQEKIELLRQHLQGTLDESAMREWVQWMQETSLEEFNDIASAVNDAFTSRTAMPAAFQQALEAKVDEVEREENEAAPTAIPVHRVHFLRTAWFKYAAAILLIIGIGSYLYITNQSEKPSVTQQRNPSPVKNDVLPGGNKATLTLADGRKINLHSAKIGELALQGNMRIQKTGEGSVVYEDSRAAKGTENLLLNTLATPRGGQYQLTLPDGSRVWLNAESSITYPTAFNGNERKVSITGEAYFEVAKDKTKKFIVDVAGKANVEVLGTHFNVNAYTEENTIATTLLEGSIRLSVNAHKSDLPAKAVHTSLTLKPGQQGQLTQEQLSLAANPDVEQVIAWKNGSFNFEKMPLAAALREIARWYDVEVIYPDGIPETTIYGGMGRDLNLSEVLKVLEGLGVKATIDQKKLYISK